MKHFFMIFCFALFLQLALCQQYSDFWKNNGYDDELAVSLSRIRNGEQLAQELQKNSSPEALFELGRLCFARGLYRQALAYFRQTEFGGDSRILCIALCQMILGETDSSISAFSAITDSNIRPWSNIGLAKLSNVQLSATIDYPYLSNFLSKASTETVITKGFTLQFGAFSDSLRAVKLMERLKDIGLSPYITKIEIQGKTLFRVRGEHFSTKEEAQQAGEALGDEFIFMVVPEE